MTNKINQFENTVENAIHVIRYGGSNQSTLEGLVELKVFLSNLQGLKSYFEDAVPVQAEVQQAPVTGPATQVMTGAISFPSPNPPAAVELSSGVSAQVDGCIAAQPAPVRQSAAQAQLDSLLASQQQAPATQEAQAPVDAQAQLNALLAQQQEKEALTAQMQQQLAQQQAAQASAQAQLTSSLQAQVQQTEQQVQAQPMVAPVVPTQPVQPAQDLTASLLAQIPQYMPTPAVQQAQAPIASVGLDLTESMRQQLAQAPQAQAIPLPDVQVEAPAPQQGPVRTTLAELEQGGN